MGIVGSARAGSWGKPDPPAPCPLVCAHRYLGKTVMLDCGIHPGFSGQHSLPYYDAVDLSTVDVMLVRAGGATQRGRPGGATGPAGASQTAPRLRQPA